MNFDEKLRNYAKLLVYHGLNVQEGQEVYIRSETIHRDLVTYVAEEAYRKGASYVEADLKDPRIGKIRLRETKKREDLRFVPPHVKTKFIDMTKRHAATLTLCGEEDPDLLSNEDPTKLNEMQLAYRQAIKEFYDEGDQQIKGPLDRCGRCERKMGPKSIPSPRP